MHQLGLIFLVQHYHHFRRPFPPISVNATVSSPVTSLSLAVPASLIFPLYAFGSISFRSMDYVTTFSSVLSLKQKRGIFSQFIVKMLNYRGGKLSIALQSLTSGCCECSQSLFY
ncbi:hypothetical protein VNO80_06134 [Phaseolus coccineus]|uniref:Uncharacterized protein n=1 Tax=Phaseolus coccineus TaxID=3886 RepID=A0AAN9NH68_PHACN